MGILQFIRRKFTNTHTNHTNNLTNCHQALTKKARIIQLESQLLRLQEQNSVLRVDATAKDGTIARLRSLIDDVRLHNADLDRKVKSQSVVIASTTPMLAELEVTRAALRREKRRTEVERAVDALEHLFRKFGAPEMPECQICLRNFSSTAENLVPRVLGCGHTICTECAAQIGNNKDHIVCPFDRKKTNKSASDLSKNWLLVHTIDTRQKALSDEQQKKDNRAFRIGY